MRRIVTSERGQATIEFALTLIFMMAFILFFLQLALVLAWSNYVQYATFMSARAYQAAGPTRIDQTERATIYMRKMVKRGGGNADKLPFIAKGNGGGDTKGMKFDHDQLDATNRDFSWLEGVSYEFKAKVFMIPLAGSDDGVNSLTLTSESWLSREPAFDECGTEMGAMGGIFDNGC